MSSSFLDRQNTVAGPGFDRFMVPPAALAVHLCIGQAYAFSTFNLPLTKLIGLTQSAPNDWNLKDVGWIFSIAIVFLGSSAALFGRWVERVGPRKSMFVSALCFAGGFLVSAVGVHWHQLWIIYLGYGVLGGCGLGIGYISPVSTLIKWFPDRPGMATGMAIMGFGGAALGDADGALQDADIERRARDLRHHGRHLFHVHDDRRVRGSRTRGRLETRRLDRAVAAQTIGHFRQCRGRHGLAYAAILAALGGVVHERDGRHRRARSSLSHDSGDFQWAGDAGGRGGLRRLDQPVQHGGEIFLGFDLGLHRAAQYLHDFLLARHRAVFERANLGPPG